MCGVAGFWGPHHEYPQQIARSMADTIVHRGPDDSGEWIDPQRGIGLAHRRLSIIDLSSAGHQPMTSDCGRFVIAYNGEIYNHEEIRTALVSCDAAPSWRGHSDTETLLAAISRWGLDIALEQANGMFAFALWDRQEQELILARDRMGEKPLYFGVVGGHLLFGSELKALRAHPAWRGDIDRDALALYFRYQYIPAPHSIYCGINKVMPGHYTVVSRDDSFSVQTRCYWDISEVAHSAVDARSRHETDDFAGELEALLQDSVAKRLMADVPVGAFLSGGYDSSLVVALAQSQRTQPIKTFTIGFEQAAYDEATHARAVAKHLGTDHVELYVTPDAALDVVPKLPHIWCEPFGDSSQIPTYLVSQLAQEQVTVSLSGDGGDELFYGYSRYFLTERIWRALFRVPGWARRVGAGTVASIPTSWFDALASLAPAGTFFSRLSYRLPLLAGIAATQDYRTLYQVMVSHWKHPEALVLGASEPETAFSREFPGSVSSLPEMMMLTDMLSYLPDDILVKVDRASMANSLEARVPLLDHRLVELAWRIPTTAKRDGSGGKRILKDIVHRHVPQKIMDRPKQGFGVPIGHWLRGPLRDWADALLSEHRIRNEGYLNAGLVQQKWRSHLAGKSDEQYYLWDVLMFEAWLDHNKGT